MNRCLKVCKKCQHYKGKVLRIDGKYYSHKCGMHCCTLEDYKYKSISSGSSCPICSGSHSSSSRSDELEYIMGKKAFEKKDTPEKCPHILETMVIGDD